MLQRKKEILWLATSLNSNTSSKTGLSLKTTWTGSSILGIIMHYPSRKHIMQGHLMCTIKKPRLSKSKPTKIMSKHNPIYTLTSMSRYISKTKKKVIIQSPKSSFTAHCEETSPQTNLKTLHLKSILTRFHLNLVRKCRSL